jgi:hypothetical protein
MKEPQIPEQMSQGRLPRKIEVNIADENLAIPESPEVSLNCSKVSIGDESSRNEHLAKIPFSPLPQLLKVNTEAVWHLQLGFNNLSTRSCLPDLNFSENNLSMAQTCCRIRVLVQFELHLGVP